MKVILLLSLLLCCNTISYSAGCICTREYRPVCGVSGTEYANACVAACKNDAIAYEGKCNGCDKVCGSVFDPVCADGRDESSLCQARCKKAKYIYPGACRDCLDCSNDEAAVCGDGVTYKNRCIAETCYKAIHIHNGACEDCSQCGVIGQSVCSDGGERFYNECYAKCQGVKSYKPC